MMKGTGRAGGVGKKRNKEGWGRCIGQDSVTLWSLQCVSLQLRNVPTTTQDCPPNVAQECHHQSPGLSLSSFSTVLHTSGLLQHHTQHRKSPHCNAVRPCLCPGLSLSQLKIFPVKAQNCPCHSPGQIPSHVKLSPYSPGLSHHRPELSYNSPRLSTSQTVSVTACDCPPAPQSPGVSPSKSRLSQS